ncbi:hypothetical protein ACE01N_19875 [Saccharicrinis sp. FJH2]|uniref:hypothetical protein n=1 Tax=Saccharicrinis sp. FJH65 TaxID=3344659 RepID=UPI0035F4CBAC
MKYIYLIFLTFLSCNSTKTNNGFIINDNLIKPFNRSEYLNPENTDINFIQIAQYTIDLNGNNKLDTVKLYKIKDWTDPGDFQQIEVVLDNNQSIVKLALKAG